MSKVKFAMHLGKLGASYKQKFGKDAFLFHGAFIILGLFVDPTFALGLLVVSWRSAAVVAPLALAWGWLQSYWGSALDQYAVYPATELFTQTSAFSISAVAFIAGVLLRRVVDGRFSREVAIVAGVIVLVLLSQGRGGLDEFEARSVSYKGPELARLDYGMKSLNYVSEVRRIKGFNSPEDLAASYVFQRQLWNTLSLNGVSDYNSFLVYRQQRSADSKLLTTMSEMGKTDEWGRLMTIRYNDPEWPDNPKIN